MEEWEKIARNLPCGRSVRVVCCKKDRSRVISHSEQGYGAYCFRCGYKKWKPHGVRSVAEMLRHRRELDEYLEERGSLSLPDDFTLDIPKEGLQWILKAGVGSDIAKAYRFGWSESMSRVVLPVFENEQLQAVQCRAVLAGQKPKYVNKTGQSKCALFHSDDKHLLNDPIPDTVVLTEDILSAVRVGRIQHSAASLGTSLSDKAAARLLLEYKNFIIWYDGDEAGVKGSRKVKKVLDMQGGNTYFVRTKYDPKDFNNEEIKRILNDLL